MEVLTVTPPCTYFIYTECPGPGWDSGSGIFALLVVIFFHLPGERNMLSELLKLKT